MPVERYAVAYVEQQQAPVTQDELQKAEVRLARYQLSTASFGFGIFSKLNIKQRCICVMAIFVVVKIHLSRYVIQEEVSIAKEEWELGHLKAIKEEDERRAEVEEDDMLYMSLHESMQNKSSKPGKSKPKLYSYGGWEFSSIDDDAVASFLDDSVSQNLDEDTSTEPSLLNSQLATGPPRVRAHKKKANAVKTKLSSRKKMDSTGAISVPKRKYWTKKRRAEFGMEENITEEIVVGKRSKLLLKSVKLQKLPKKASHRMQRVERIGAESVTLDGKNVEHVVRPRLVCPAVSKVPRLKMLKQISRPSNVVQHRPLVQPIRSSDLGIRPLMVRMPGPRAGARTIAEIGAQSPSQPTPILEKLGAAVLANASPVNQTSRLTQIVSSISAAAALQNTVLASSLPGSVQYVITTNGRTAIPPVRQTPLLVGNTGSLATVGSNLRSSVVYQVPTARRQLPLQTAVQSVTAGKLSQPPRLVLTSSAPSSSAARPSFVLSASGGDRQSFVLFPTSNRQSYILAPAVSASQPAMATTAVSTGTSAVIRPPNFTLQMSPPRLQRTVQQPIQPAPAQRTIQLAPTPPRPLAANTLPILEKFALQLNSVQPAVAATYEVVARSGELIAATSPTRSALQQVVYPTVSPPSQIVRFSGSTGTNNLQLVNHMMVRASVAKPVQTIAMPQFVIRQPRQVAPISSVITGTPAVLPVRNQLAGTRIVSGTNLVQVPSSQLSTVIIVDSRPEGQDSSATARQS